MRHHRTDPTANALARGPAKGKDIAAIRRDLDGVEQDLSRRQKVDATRRERDVRARHERPARP